MVISVHELESTGIEVILMLREFVENVGILKAATESGFDAPVPLAVTEPVLASDLPTICTVEFIVIEMCARMFP